MALDQNDLLGDKNTLSYGEVQVTEGNITVFKMYEGNPREIDFDSS